MRVERFGDFHQPQITVASSDVRLGLFESQLPALFIVGLPPEGLPVRLSSFTNNQRRMFELEKNNHTVMYDNVVGNPVVDLLAPGSDSDNDDEPGPSSDEEAEDDDSLMMDVPLMRHAGELPAPKLEAPPEGMSWKESAILECMDLALKSHDDDHPQENFVWKSPLEHDEKCIVDSLKDWIPTPLSLPVWAVDPCLGTWLAPTNSIEQGSRDRETSSTKGTC